MSEHFIKNIEIKNFKCFEDFKAEGFGRVNLIGGKNNVGKTAFMEAVYVNVYATNVNTFICALNNIKFMRENLNVLANNCVYSKQDFIEISNTILVKSNINKAYFKINEENGIKKYYFEYQNNITDININDFSFSEKSLENIVFIDNFGLFNSHIMNHYSSVQRKDEEDFLNCILQKFDNRIESFKIIDKLPQCKVKGQWLELTELGDGIRHLVSIVTSLYISEHGYLFIDELDNGIHYTMLDELWKVILEVSDKLNVQVFATTHSKECIESYARVAENLDDEDITMTTMARNLKDELKALVWDRAQFFSEMEQNHEVRGW